METQPWSMIGAVGNVKALMFSLLMQGLGDDNAIPAPALLFASAIASSRQVQFHFFHYWCPSMLLAHLCSNLVATLALLSLPWTAPPRTHKHKHTGRV